MAQKNENCFITKPTATKLNEHTRGRRKETSQTRNYRVRRKLPPPEDLLHLFPAIAWNFTAKFYRHIYSFNVHNTAFAASSTYAGEADCCSNRQVIITTPRYRYDNLSTGIGQYNRYNNAGNRILTEIDGIRDEDYSLKENQQQDEPRRPMENAASHWVSQPDSAVNLDL